MSVQKKAVKAIKAAAKKTATEKVIATPSEASSAATAKTEKNPEAGRLAKKFRRASWGQTHNYPEGAFATSTKWVREQFEAGKTVAEIEKQIEAIKLARKEKSAVSPMSGAAAGVKPAKRTGKAVGGAAKK
jgi:hypothetical protein